MILRRLRLTDVRSYATLDWRPGPGLNVIVGANGSGKTNLLEAIAMVCGMRLRPIVREADLIRRGAGAMGIVARLERDAARGEDVREHDVAFRIGGRSRRLTRDDNPARPGQDGMPTMVPFTPDDLDMVKGGPEARRQLLERDFAQLSLAHRDLLRRYGRAVVQRNAVLRAAADGTAREDALPVWDESVARLGASVQAWRARTVAAMAPRASAAYDRVAARASRFALIYRPRLDLRPDGAGGTHADLDDPRRLLASLHAARPAELARGYTLVGPHRDDLGFTLDGNEMRGFASQGEERTAVIAVKLAFLEHLYAERLERPLLALDDVLSELDERRQEHLLSEANPFQTFLTTAVSVPEVAATVWRTVGGGLREWRAGG